MIMKKNMKMNPEEISVERKYDRKYDFKIISLISSYNFLHIFCAVG